MEGRGVVSWELHECVGLHFTFWRGHVETQQEMINEPVDKIYVVYNL